MADVTLEFLGEQLKRVQRELRDALQTMQLRDDQREASHQALVRTLTSQIVAVGAHVDEQLAAFEARFIEQLAGFEARLIDQLDRLAPRDQG